MVVIQRIKSNRIIGKVGEGDFFRFAAVEIDDYLHAVIVIDIYSPQKDFE